MRLPAFLRGTSFASTDASHATQTFGSPRLFLFFSRSFSPSNRYADSLPTFSPRSLGARARGGGGEDFTPFFSPRDKAERKGKERKGNEFHVLLTGSISVHLSPNSLPSLADAPAPFFFPSFQAYFDESRNENPFPLRLLFPPEEFDLTDRTFECSDEYARSKNFTPGGKLIQGFQTPLLLSSFR